MEGGVRRQSRRNRLREGGLPGLQGFSTSFFDSASFAAVTLFLAAEWIIYVAPAMQGGLEGNGSLTMNRTDTDSVVSAVWKLNPKNIGSRQTKAEEDCFYSFSFLLLRLWTIKGPSHHQHDGWVRGDISAAGLWYWLRDRLPLPWVSEWVSMHANVRSGCSAGCSCRNIPLRRNISRLLQPRQQHPPPTNGAYGSILLSALEYPADWWKS